MKPKRAVSQTTASKASKVPDPCFLTFARLLSLLAVAFGGSRNLRLAKTVCSLKTCVWERMPEAVRCVRQKRCETLEKQGDEGLCVC